VGRVLSLRARRFGRVPPTYVLTCGHDSLRRAREPFLKRLRSSGVPVWQDVFAPLDRLGMPDGEPTVERLRTRLATSTSFRFSS